MKIAIVTDAWATAGQRRGDDAVPDARHAQRAATRSRSSRRAISDDPVPDLPEIRLAWSRAAASRRRSIEFEPDAVHIATEGPLGAAARRYCDARDLGFTTSYHTQFPQYVRKRVPIPESWSYAFCVAITARAAHARRDGAASGANSSQHGFDNVVLWSRGVDAELFSRARAMHLGAPRPIWIYVGRVAVEKNLDAFLALDLPGTKVVVGDGRTAPSSQRALPRRSYSRAIDSARSSRHVCRAPTCSCFRAGPTPSAS